MIERNPLSTIIELGIDQHQPAHPTTARTSMYRYKTRLTLTAIALILTGPAIGSDGGIGSNEAEELQYLLDDLDSSINQPPDTQSTNRFAGNVNDDLVEALDDEALATLETTLQERLLPCWSVSALEETDHLAVSIQVSLNADGTVERADIPEADRYNSESDFQASVDSVRRAILNSACQPWDFPPGSYPQWQEIQLVFDPEAETVSLDRPEPPSGSISDPPPTQSDRLAVSASEHLSEANRLWGTVMNEDAHRSPEERVDDLAVIMDQLDAILVSYPNSEIAAALAEGEQLGSISFAAIEWELLKIASEQRDGGSMSPDPDGELFDRIERALDRLTDTGHYQAADHVHNFGVDCTTLGNDECLLEVSFAIAYHPSLVWADRNHLLLEYARYLAAFGRLDEALTVFRAQPSPDDQNSRTELITYGEVAASIGSEGHLENDQEIFDKVYDLLYSQSFENNDRLKFIGTLIDNGYNDKAEDFLERLIPNSIYNDGQIGNVVLTADLLDRLGRTEDVFSIASRHLSLIDDELRNLFPVIDADQRDRATGDVAEILASQGSTRSAASLTVEINDHLNRYRAVVDVIREAQSISMFNNAEIESLIEDAHEFDEVAELAVVLLNAGDDERANDLLDEIFFEVFLDLLDGKTGHETQIIIQILLEADRMDDLSTLVPLYVDIGKEDLSSDLLFSYDAYLSGITAVFGSEKALVFAEPTTEGGRTATADTLAIIESLRDIGRPTEANDLLFDLLHDVGRLHLPQDRVDELRLIYESASFRRYLQ